MALTYAQIEKILLAQAQQEAAVYEKRRRLEAQQDLSAFTDDARASFEQTQDAQNAAYYDKKKQEVKQRAQASVTGALAKRLGVEQTASQGLAKSGLANVARESSKTVQANAEQSSRDRQEAVRETVNRAIGQAYTKMQQKIAAKQKALYTAAERDIAKRTQTLLQSARKRAEQMAKV